MCDTKKEMNQHRIMRLGYVHMQLAMQLTYTGCCMCISVWILLAANNESNTCVIKGHVSLIDRLVVYVSVISAIDG